MSRKPGSKVISKIKRTTILDLNDVGVKMSDIAAYYNMPQATVRTILRRGRKIGKERKEEKANREGKKIFITGSRYEQF